MKKSILVVDDEELDRELLRQVFESDYNMIMASNGKEALAQLAKHSGQIVIILMDLAMPVLNGYQVLQVLRTSESYRSIPVAMITAADSQDLAVACYTMGAVSVINKPFSPKIVRKQINNIIDMYQENVHLKENLTYKLQKINSYYSNLVDAISSIAEFRGYGSGNHMRNIKAFTKILGQTYMKLFPESKLTPEKIELIALASSTHDIGKIAIPDSILLKTDALTSDETEILKSHTTKGCEILAHLSPNSELFQVSYDICRFHHERFDGNGYPDGLSGDKIPLSAQLVSIAHAYASLIEDQVDKKHVNRGTAFKMIMGNKGEFSPNLLKCFEQSRESIEAFLDSEQ